MDAHHRMLSWHSLIQLRAVKDWVHPFLMFWSHTPIVHLHWYLAEKNVAFLKISKPVSPQPLNGFVQNKNHQIRKTSIIWFHKKAVSLKFKLSCDTLTRGCPITLPGKIEAVPLPYWTIWSRPIMQPGKIEVVLLPNRVIWSGPIAQPGKSEAVPLPNQAICGCPVTQQDNIRLPRCLTGQDRSHPVVQPGSINAVPMHNWLSTIEAVLLCNKHIEAFLYRIPVSSTRN